MRTVCPSLPVRLSSFAKQMELILKRSKLNSPNVKIYLPNSKRLTLSRKYLLSLMEDTSYSRVMQFLSILLPLFQELQIIADVSRRARIHAVLDWHHLNLRRGAATFVLNTVLAPLLGLPLNKQAAAEGEKVLSSSLSVIENIWLKGDGRYLLGGFRPSIADLSLVCEIMQLELLDEKDRDRVLGPHKKVQQWIESTRNSTRPHFDEVHDLLYKLKMKLSVQRSSHADGEMKSGIKASLISKM